MGYVSKTMDQGVRDILAIIATLRALVERRAFGDDDVSAG
jgi:hypothetical protein